MRKVKKIQWSSEVIQRRVTQDEGIKTYRAVSCSVSEVYSARDTSGDASNSSSPSLVRRASGSVRGEFDNRADEEAPSLCRRVTASNAPNNGLTLAVC
jgi:hypothetical protein